ncbi:MAG TPA: cytochrome C oxidase subunit IV family protein [Terriglobia bacterium]|nr:cytochrome C oxidase subunit IV family protein [Terriglobia bacterium]
MVGHVLSKKLYVTVFALLIALTALTTGVAYIDLGAYNTVAALAIAVVKASLVVLFFMHLKYTPGMTRIALAAAVGWLVILLALTLADFHTRSWTPVPQSWQASTAPAR